MEDPIYLDNAATTPVLPEVADAVREAMLSLGGNAASQHAAGRAARRVLEDARARITELLGARSGGHDADRLLFTSGATEANNHALRGALPSGGGHLITSAIEHPSVAAIALRMEATGHAVDRLPSGRDGQVLWDALPGLVRPETRLVSVVLGNSETGVLQPVDRIVEQTRGLGAPVHTDATQAVGKVSIRFSELGVAMLSFAAHKFHGPPGIGGLLIRGDSRPQSLMAGQVDGERPGTPPVALVVGMLRALELAYADLRERADRMARLRDRLEAGIAGVAPGAVVIGGDAPRLPHTSCIALAGCDRQALMMALDQARVACSTGSACASGSSEPSPTLLAMGLPEEQIRGALRFSVGVLTTAAEVDEAVARIGRVLSRF